MNRLCNSTLYWMFDNADGRFIKYDDWTAINEMTAADASFGVVLKFVIKLMMMMFL